MLFRFPAHSSQNIYVPPISYYQKWPKPVLTPIHERIKILTGGQRAVQRGEAVRPTSPGIGDDSRGRRGRHGAAIARCTGRVFDLETTHRVAEFKLSSWKGHDGARQRGLFADVVGLVSRRDRSARARSSSLARCRSPSSRQVSATRSRRCQDAVEGPTSNPRRAGTERDRDGLQVHRGREHRSDRPPVNDARPPVDRRPQQV